MRFVSRAAACAVLVAGTGPPASAVGQSPTSPATYDEWYAAVRARAPDPTRGAPVSDVVLRRDAATIELSSGDLHLLGAGDRTVGAVFVGAGRFRFTPPPRVEREHLARYHFLQLQ